MKKKTILVTGAAGFIGFHLSKKLCKSGFDVIGIDNLNDYYEVFLKKMRLEKLGIHVHKQENQRIESITLSNFTFYKSDILDYESLSKCVEDNKVDIIINLAAQAGVRHSLKFPHDYISIYLLSIFP